MNSLSKKLEKFDVASMETLKGQCRYKLEFDVKKLDKITGGFNKRLFRAEWLNRNTEPIVIAEIKGDNASQEAILYLTLEHENIIKTFGVVGNPTDFDVSPKSLYLVQEYAADGDLYRLISTKMFIPSPLVILEILRQICSAMIYLSKNRIVHGDLACRNVLAFRTHPEEPKKNLFKLIDFDLTKNGDNQSGDVDVYPIRYAAPEVLRTNGRSNYSEKSDVFSFGVLIWEITTQAQHMPYENISADEEIRKRVIGGERLSKPKNCDSDLWVLVSSCWLESPESRPNFRKIDSLLLQIRSHATDEVRSPHTELRHTPDSGNRRKSSIHHPASPTKEVRRLDPVMIPCEICNERFVSTIFYEHQRICLQQYDEKIEQRQIKPKIDDKASTNYQASLDHTNLASMWLYEGNSSSNFVVENSNSEMPNKSASKSDIKTKNQSITKPSTTTSICERFVNFFRRKKN